METKKGETQGKYVVEMAGRPMNGEQKLEKNEKMGNIGTKHHPNAGKLVRRHGSSALLSFSSAFSFFSFSFFFGLIPESENTRDSMSQLGPGE